MNKRMTKQDWVFVVVLFVVYFVADALIPDVQEYRSLVISLVPGVITAAYLLYFRK